MGMHEMTTMVMMMVVDERHLCFGISFVLFLFCSNCSVLFLSSLPPLYCLSI